jgi:hypothetical protein
MVWPKKPAAGINLESATALSAKDVADMTLGLGAVYTKVEVTYRNYITRTCYEYPLKKGALILDEPEPCSDPDANCADEECR